MKKSVIIAIIFLLFFAVGDSYAKKIKPLNMVFVPASEKAESSDFESLINIVTELSGIEFKFIKVTDYNSAVEAMRVGRADIAWFGAATYVIAADIANAEAFAAGVPKGKKDAGYFTYFVTRKDSTIKTLADAKGKILALNHIGSTSGDYIPQVEILKANLNIHNKTHFKTVFYAGSHDAALMAVVNGQADICGMSSHNFHGRIKDGTVSSDVVKIIHTSPKVPPAPLAYSKKLPSDIRKKIKEAVLVAHKHGKIAGWGGEMERYIAVTDEDFNIMRDVRKIVESGK